jgi:hypothetical protein
VAAKSEPAGLAAAGPAGLVDVLDRGLADAACGLRVGLVQGGSHLLFLGADRAQGDGHAQDVGQDLLDRAFAVVAAGREVADQSGEPRPEAVAADLLRDRGVGDLAAGAEPAVGLVLGQRRGQRRQLGDLVPARRRVAGAGLGGQRMLAALARARQVVHHLVDPLRRQAVAVVTFVPFLAAALAAGGGPGAGLLEVVGAGRRRGVAGVLIQAVPQLRHLLAEGFDLLLELGDERAGGGQFLLQNGTPRAIRLLTRRIHATAVRLWGAEVRRGSERLRLHGLPGF